ncbi:hypothetical protein [Solibacillus isronensis]|uniref:hypothetical protein n=1 Tax=Solibacillus isronensis TaxID=412383 RepID=UPI0039A09791
MKNTLADLNNHLFAQMERLSEEDISAEELAREVDRSKAIVSVSSQIIQNGNLALNAQKFVADTNGRSKATLPEYLEG